MTKQTKPYPDAATLQTGDILWPRHPEARAFRLPFDNNPTEAAVGLPPQELLRGLTEAFALPDPDASQLQASLTRELQVMTEGFFDRSGDVLAALRDFVLLWQSMAWSQGDAVVQQKQALELPDWVKLPKWLRTSLNDVTFFGVYVGHVALIERDSQNQLWVLECTYTVNGIRVLPYEKWLALRQSPRVGAHVWHGRPQLSGQDIAPAVGRVIVDEAHRLRMEGTRPYAIFDTTDLANDRSMYCAEYVWHCVNKAGIDLDARSSLARLLPYVGPAVLSRSPSIRMINEPGNRPY